MTISTEIIIIRKFPYNETSLIAAGLTPEFGKITLLIKGAFRKNNSTMPVIDLFRVLEVQFKKNLQKDLYPVYSASLLRNYDNIASSLKNYNEACSICSFIFSNTHPFISVPGTFKSVCKAFESLSEAEDSSVPWYMLVKLAFLYENGFLPEIEQDASGRLELLNAMLLASTGFRPLPDVDDNYMKAFHGWIDNVCRYHDLKI